jgi:hypothetical protein
MKKFFGFSLQVTILATLLSFLALLLYGINGVIRSMVATDNTEK